MIQIEGRWPGLVQFKSPLKRSLWFILSACFSCSGMLKLMMNIINNGSYSGVGIITSLLYFPWDRLNWKTPFIWNIFFLMGIWQENLYYLTILLFFQSHRLVEFSFQLYYTLLRVSHLQYYLLKIITTTPSTL